MNVVIKPSAVMPDCTIGCPVQIRYELALEADCTSNGMPDINCTDWVDVLMEVQPYESKSGEISSCSVDGILVNIHYKFWFKPQDNYHLVTPNSDFISDTFDASVLKGAKCIVSWLGKEWLVWNLKNWTSGCDGECNQITLQEGVLVPYQQCKKDAIPSKPEFCIDNSWSKV